MYTQTNTHVKNEGITFNKKMALFSFSHNKTRHKKKTLSAAAAALK